MNYTNRQLQKNEIVRERYILSRDRIISLTEELSENTGNISQAVQIMAEYSSFFHKYATFLAKVIAIMEEIEAGNYFNGKSIEQLREENQQLYKEVLTDYESSYLNPAYKGGPEQYRRQLCFLASELYGCINYAFEKRMDLVTVLMELFLEVYGIFSYREEGQDITTQLNEAIYYYVCDYIEDAVEDRLSQQLCPDASIFPELLREMDDTDERYLYRFGFYVGPDSRDIFNYLAKLPKETISKMAEVYTEGYRRGFEMAGIDLSKKRTVNIRYFLGFERVVKEAVRQFEKMGLTAVIYPSAHTSIHRKDVSVGLISQSPNRQWEYDHRMDEALYLDKRIVERRLDALRNAYKKYEKEADEMAGPAVIEVFGETPFVPDNKPEREQLSIGRQKLKVEYQSEAAVITNKYQPGDKRSFTIIAWPLPSIAKEPKTFEDIFNETIKVNTLDTDRYEKIQQRMIDVLDGADHVRILGQNGNETDFKINLWELKNPDRETLFENCLSDVNIPLGEVFTSPRLTGTDGILHVKKVFLEGLLYVNLKLEFKDGMVISYSCDREENDGKEYIRENILKCHDSLPIGEFAIGTNTAAYAMGKKYGILSVLPILIAEKMGPHFAVGDTCYSMREEQKVYNPDKKEVIARENECSLKRKEDIAAAYFNCHTDITIPYEELGELLAVHSDGTSEKIIEGGRFVLEGTEELNAFL